MKSLKFTITTGVGESMRIQCCGVVFHVALRAVEDVSPKNLRWEKVRRSCTSKTVGMRPKVPFKSQKDRFAHRVKQRLSIVDYLR